MPNESWRLALARHMLRTSGMPYRRVTSLFLFLAATTAGCGSSSSSSGGGGGPSGGGASSGGGTSGTGGAGVGGQGGSSGTAGAGASSGTAGDGAGGATGGSVSTGGGGGSGASATGGSSGTGGSSAPGTCPVREPRGEPPSYTPPPCELSDTPLRCEYEASDLDGGVGCRVVYTCQCLSDHMGGVDCWWMRGNTVCADGGM
jgi:hypothetical protein